MLDREVFFLKNQLTLTPNPRKTKPKIFTTTSQNKG